MLEEIVYEGKDGIHTVPAGFVTDFASVPAMVQWLIPSYGKYALAAIVHDWYCIQLANRYKIEQLNMQGVSTSWQPDDICAMSSRDVDGMFRRMMRELEVPFLRRWVMWTGVRWGALFGKARRRGIARDLPMMILWSILAAPIVVPVTLLAGIALMIDKIFEKLVGRFIR